MESGALQSVPAMGGFMGVINVRCQFAGLAVLLLLGMPGCRDFKVGDGHQQDHALLAVARKQLPTRAADAGVAGEVTAYPRTVNADMILRTADQGGPSLQQITATGADSIASLASWAGLTVDEFLRKNPNLRKRTPVVGEALSILLTPGEASRFHGLRKVAVARWQLQSEVGKTEPVRTVEHVMVDGEGVADLLLQYVTTEDLLMRENGALRIGSLRPGQIVRVPILAARPSES